jgi:hypothetical protein
MLSAQLASPSAASASSRGDPPASISFRTPRAVVSAIPGSSSAPASDPRKTPAGRSSGLLDAALRNHRGMDGPANDSADDPMTNRGNNPSFALVSYGVFDADRSLFAACSPSPQPRFRVRLFFARRTLPERPPPPAAAAAARSTISARRTRACRRTRPPAAAASATAGRRR